MKKLHLLLLALMLSTVGMAQTKLTTATGSLTIQNPNEGIVTTYPVDKLFFTVANNNVKIYLIGQGPSSTNIIANNSPVQYLLNGASGTDTATVKTFLIGNGVGKAPSGGGGGGGGGDASAANQTTEIARLSSILAKISADPATQTFQSTGNNSLNSLDAKTPSLGQKTSANSTPVVIASDQSILNTSITYPLMARVSTAPTVTTASSTIAAANAAGYMVFIQNNGAADIWINIGGTATLSAPSILIKAGGGSYATVNNRPDTQAITAISTVSQSITVITY